MLIAGLTSISFRKHSAEEIITLAANAGLTEIEWGSDVHILPGEVEKAAEIRQKCREMGIKTATYGSYFRIGKTPNEEIYPVLESARALGARVIRLWGYDRYITPEDSAEWDNAVEGARTISQAAKEYGMTLALECHIKTITESPENTLKFLGCVSSENLRCYWQPNQYKDTAYNLRALEMLLPYLEAVHVFNWRGTERLPLSYAIDTWRDYVKVIKTKSEKADIPMLLEFMPDGRAESLAAEANALRHIATE